MQIDLRFYLKIHITKVFKNIGVSFFGVNYEIFSCFIFSIYCVGCISVPNFCIYLFVY